MFLQSTCVTLNRCVDCTSKERVCNIISIMEVQADSSRMKLFIVDEECGY
ncbi:hypothetical protein CSC2_34830 [Clostridium zeae]|uniref:Uncharacterized protein n=1 Tax=Clostridium zeae TaxID=2759022 RepID=A0ABQ1EDU6_9CLOT|nr:hypothetical protein CSC2_34830 [Clostridium zeae]